jgi:hypothetical protein
MMRAGEFTIDDLFDLVFPSDGEVPGEICMVFQTFLDDSGHKANRLMVSAGFCAKRDVWRDFEADWKKILAHHQIPYFKSSECNHVSGQFRKLRKGNYAQEDEKAEARGIRQDFLDVVARHDGIVGVGVAIEMEPYERMARLPEAKEVLPQNPYRAAHSCPRQDISAVSRV